MTRSWSFLLAIAVACIFLFVVLWGMRVEGRTTAGIPPNPPETPQPGEVVLIGSPTGAETALGDCVVCHSVDPKDASRYAPELYGVVGRNKGASPWFNYSTALRMAEGVWTEAELDKYLAHPGTYLPGTKKTLAGISDEKERRKIVEALLAISK